MLHELIASLQTVQGALAAVFAGIGALVVACEALVRTLRGVMVVLEKIALSTPTRLDDQAFGKVDSWLSVTYQALCKVSSWIPRGTIPAVKK